MYVYHIYMFLVVSLPLLFSLLFPLVSNLDLAQDHTHYVNGPVKLRQTSWHLDAAREAY